MAQNFCEVIKFMKNINIHGKIYVIAQISTMHSTRQKEIFFSMITNQFTEITKTFCHVNFRLCSIGRIQLQHQLSYSHAVSMH